jgi:hypothetical protein
MSGQLPQSASVNAVRLREEADAKMSKEKMIFISGF